MSVTIKQFTNDPFIVIEFDENVDTAAISAAYAQMLNHYPIIDLRAAGANYRQIIRVWKELMQGIAGAAVATQLAATFVGQPHMAEFFENEGLTFFTDREAALSYTRISA